MRQSSLNPFLNLPAILQTLIGQHVGQLTDELARLTCPVCGIKYMEFRAEGRLGCPHDYTVFRAGLEPLRGSIRGGTDGSRLSFMGLPCPNIFAGEHAFHSRLEWVSRQDMEKAVQTIVHLATIWEERA